MAHHKVETGVARVWSPACLPPSPRPPVPSAFLHSLQLVHEAMPPKKFGLNRAEDIGAPIAKVDPIEASQDDDFEKPLIPRKQVAPGRRFVEATVGPVAAAPPRRAPVIRSAHDPAPLLYVVPPKLKPIPKGPSGQRAVDLLWSGTPGAGSAFVATAASKSSPPPVPPPAPASKWRPPDSKSANPAPPSPAPLAKSPPRKQAAKKPLSNTVDLVSEEEEEGEAEGKHTAKVALFCAACVGRPSPSLSL